MVKSNENIFEQNHEKGFESLLFVLHGKTIIRSMIVNRNNNFDLMNDKRKRFFLYLWLFHGSFLFLTVSEPPNYLSIRFEVRKKHISNIMWPV